jgi:hypothetical protein
MPSQFIERSACPFLYPRRNRRANLLVSKANSSLRGNSGQGRLRRFAFLCGLVSFLLVCRCGLFRPGPPGAGPPSKKAARQGIKESCQASRFRRSAFTVKPRINRRISDADSPCRKGDREAKAVAVGYSPMRVLADASGINGSPRDHFEIHEISKEEFEN